MRNSHRCEICNVNVHRTTILKHLRSKKHLKTIKQNEMIIPEWFFKQEQTPIKNKVKNVYNPKPLKQIAQENIKLKDKELDKELVKKMIITYYFIDENLKIGFKINLESQNINHTNSLLNIESNFPDIGNKRRHIKES